jgi:ATP-binding cassette subfamily B protein
VSASLHEEQDLGRPVDRALVRRLLGYLRPYRGQVALAVALLLSSALLQLAGPTVTRLALDRAIPAKDARLLGVLAGLFALALALEFAADYAQTMVTARIGQRAMLDLRMAVFAKLQRLGVAFYDRNPVGRLMTRVTSDVEALNELFTTGVVALLGDFLTLALIMGWMLATDWRLALATFAVLPPLALFVQLFRKGMRAAYRDIRTQLARINAFLQEHLSGMRVVQLFGQEARAARRHEEANRGHLDAHLRTIAVFAWLFPVLEVLIAVALGALLLAGGVRIAGGTLTIGVLAAFIQLARRFFQPMQDLAEKLNALQGAVTSSERIFQLLDEPETVREAARPVRLPGPPRGEVAFEDVWFRYPAAGSGERGAGREDEGWVLRGISFTARAGKTVALVGHTGAGKTTVLHLLLRNYDVDRGRITLDGVDVRDLSLSDLRTAIGFVPQDIFLFTGDVRANVGLDRGLPDAVLEDAVRRVGADRVLARLPAGWGHRLGERGQSLSVGERQLLAFARALAGSPAVLVLDEATSSVDAAAEELIQRAIAELLRGRTCLAVAHRLSTVQNADEILVLHHGEIRERGTHRDLLAQGGLYGALHQLQLGGKLAVA